MKRQPKSEKGQAIILIVFGMVALIAVVALAIDGSSTFTDRRHAQNAADTSALAAALAKVSSQDWVTAGLVRAASNGYLDDGVGSTVTIVSPPGAGCDGTSGPYAGNTSYLQVIIRSNVDLFFAPIIGIDQTHNCVEAIAKAEPGKWTPLAFGNAIAATSCHGKRTIAAGGTSNVLTVGGGVFSNSDHSEALYIQKSPNLVTPADKGVTAVGGVNIPSTYPSPSAEDLDQLPCPLPDYMFPEYTCDYEWVDFPPAGMTEAPAGVHCISGDFTKADLIGVGVTFVMLNKGLSWNGNAMMHLSAPTYGPTQGLLIYLPPPNDSAVTLNGTFDLDIYGSVFAPLSTVSLSGDFSGYAMHSQWIGNTVDLTGGIVATIYFDKTENYQYPDPSKIELTR